MKNRKKQTDIAVTSVFTATKRTWKINKKEQIISVVTDLMIEKRGIEWQIPVAYHIGINIH